MNDNIEIYADFLKRCLLEGAGMTYGKMGPIVENFRTLAKTNRAVMVAVGNAFDSCAKTKNYDVALTQINNSLEWIQSEASASVDCANALPQIAKTIYNALKNNKVTIRDNDSRKWRGITELDCDIHQDNRFRGNLWQTEEVYTKSGLLEKRRVLRSAIASCSQGDAKMQLTVRY